MTKESRKFIYLGLIFILVWAVNILFISPNLPMLFGENISPLIRTGIKCVLWCGYGYYFINLYNKDLSLKKKDLFKIKNISFVLKLLIILLISALVSMYLRYGKFHINDFSFDDFINKFLLVGIEEELVFRALILNGLSKKNSFIKASLITSVLFALIHIPGYIRLNLELSVMIVNCLKIFVISIFYNYIFKETESIWPIVIIHSVWDLLFFLFMA